MFHNNCSIEQVFRKKCFHLWALFIYLNTQTSIHVYTLGHTPCLFIQTHAQAIHMYTLGYTHVCTWFSRIPKMYKYHIISSYPYLLDYRYIQKQYASNCKVVFLFFSLPNWDVSHTFLFGECEEPHIGRNSKFEVLQIIPLGKFSLPKGLHAS